VCIVSTSEVLDSLILGGLQSDRSDTSGVGAPGISLQASRLNTDIFDA
jgi:hypothetical protein